MGDIANRIAEHWEIIQWACRGVGVLAAGALVYILKQGGFRALREWLTAIYAPEQVESKQEIASALQAPWAPGDEKVDALIRGIDQLRIVRTRVERRIRELQWCKWLVPALVVLSGILAVAHPDGWPFFAALGVWALLTVATFIQAAPCFMLALEHGAPKRSERPPTSASNVRVEAQPLTPEQVPAAEDEEESEEEADAEGAEPPKKRA